MAKVLEKRRRRATMVRGVKWSAVSGAVITALCSALVSWSDSCEARKEAERAAERASKVPAIAREAQKTDDELDGSYKAIARKLADIDKQLAYTLKRVDVLERLVLKTSSWHPASRAYRPPKAPLGKKEALPATPEAAAQGAAAR